jgi:hypothetical protein
VSDDCEECGHPMSEHSYLGCMNEWSMGAGCPCEVENR